MGNSVIYRPAYDAEVEYLESTGTQYIDTGIKPDNTYTFDCKVAKIQSNYNCVFWGTRNSGESTTFNEQCYLNANDLSPVTKFAEINLFSTSTDTPESNWNSGITPIVNTMYELTGMTVVSTMNQMTYPITLFGFNMIGVINPSLGICRIGYWKCYSNGVLVRDMIPVRIGSVGYMYDKVTKQLFANKGTGNFILGNDVSNAVIPQQRCVLYFGSQRSVVFERIYEEYEWLVGDGSAYINTKVKLHFATDSVYIKGSKNGVATNKARFFGNYSGGENAKSLELIYYTSVQNDTVSKPFVTDGRFGINPSSEFEFYTTPFSSTTSVSVVYDNIDTIFNVNLDDSYLSYEASNDLILLNTNDTRYCMKVDVANFKVMRSSTIILNLIPCKLLQSIPAILDGNGIARQAGECGMWDKVNDVFYGNVANSGSFTVSND